MLQVIRAAWDTGSLDVRRIICKLVTSALDRSVERQNTKNRPTTSIVIAWNIRRQDTPCSVHHGLLLRLGDTVDWDDKSRDCWRKDEGIINPASAETKNAVIVSRNLARCKLKMNMMRICGLKQHVILENHLLCQHRSISH